MKETRSKKRNRNNNKRKRKKRRKKKKGKRQKRKKSNRPEACPIDFNRSKPLVKIRLLELITPVNLLRFSRGTILRRRHVARSDQCCCRRVKPKRTCVFNSMMVPFVRGAPFPFSDVFFQETHGALRNDTENRFALRVGQNSEKGGRGSLSFLQEPSMLIFTDVIKLYLNSSHAQFP